MLKGSVRLPLFTGAATALITPFKDGKIDYVSMGKLIEWQIGQGIDALVICGTTGEAATLSPTEKAQLVKFAVDLPSRTGVNVSPRIVKILSGHPNIIGIKEASGNISQICETAACINDNFDLYSGNDDQTVPILSLGGIGCISTVSNIIPSRYSSMIHQYLDGDYIAAGKEQVKIKPLIDSIFSEVNPVPVKAALSMMGMCMAEYRLPMCPPSNKTQYLVYDTLKEFDLVK